MSRQTNLLNSLLSSFWVGGRMALVEMGSHKLRSSLSVLGVMLGVASLVAMLTLVGGIDVFLHQKMAKWIGSIRIFGTSDPPQDEKLSWSRSPGMHFSDGTYLEQESKDVKIYYRAISRRDRVAVAGETERVTLRGVSPETMSLDSENIDLTTGRWLSEQDYTTGARACLVSWEIHDDVVRRLRFAGRDSTSILEQHVVYKNTRFRIVGSFHPRDPDFRPWGLRRSVTVPLMAMQKYVTGFDPDPGMLQIEVTNPTDAAQQAENIAVVLSERHRGVRDFEYRTADWLDQLREMLGNVSLLMSILSGVSLFVGGLGIMNVTLSSIAERIHEIGVRKALGAKTAQIFVQFLAETTTLSMVGGTAGAFVGVLPIFFKEAIKKGTEGVIVPTVLAVHVMYVFAVIVLVGIVFGLYPAIKAARLDPVDALRYE